jgi:hypothetical protein
MLTAMKTWSWSELENGAIRQGSGIRKERKPRYRAPVEGGAHAQSAGAATSAPVQTVANVVSGSGVWRIGGFGGMHGSWSWSWSRRVVLCRGQGWGLVQES